MPPSSRPGSASHSRTSAWLALLPGLKASFTAAFWDGAVGAFRDATTGPVVHSQDGNVFAVLAGLATQAQAVSAFRYLSQTEQHSWGDTIADNDTWDDRARWGEEASLRSYPFISYFDVLARYAAGRDASALDLIRREWGYMLANGPRTTMWETIGPYGGPPVDSSWDHGWSSGAAPALTGYVLGISPAAPGFASFRAAPRPGDLAWARGDVPTPRGTIHFEWSRRGRRFTATVTSPVPGTVTLPGGKPVAVPAGTHVVTG
jgi:alpha-L-rhamnosidase-like protein